MAADGQPVIIRELEGARRTVELAASDLPEQGVTTGVSQRVQRTYYPGSRRPSTQVMGLEHKDIALQGWFKDHWTGTLGGALAQHVAMKQLCAGQAYCELTWGSTLVVRGRVLSYDGTFIRDGDIRYSLTFQVDESDDAEVITTTAEAVTPPSQATLTKLLNAASDAEEIARDRITTITAIRGVI